MQHNVKNVLLSCLLSAFMSHTAYSASLSEYYTVLLMYLKKPYEMGEIAPLSESVGKEISLFVKANNEHGKYYLEAGGGCGAITSCVVQKLRSQDHLDVIEINPELCELLQNRFAAYPNVKVHCCSVLDWHPDYRYDAIISTLPLLFLGLEFAESSMNYFKSVLKEQGTFSCVEYPICTFFRDLGQLFVSQKTIDFTSVQNYMKTVRNNCLVASSTIYLNIPPINVYHLCLHE